MKSAAKAVLAEAIGEEASKPQARLFSLKHDFPSEWHRFVTGNSNFVAKVKQDHFPYITQRKNITIDAIQLYAIKANKLESATPPGLDPGTFTDKLKDDGEFELSLAPDAAVLVRNKDAHIFVVIKYSLG